jgi:hypothetical protein
MDVLSISSDLLQQEKKREAGLIEYSAASFEVGGFLGKNLTSIQMEET